MWQNPSPIVGRLPRIYVLLRVPHSVDLRCLGDEACESRQHLMLCLAQGVLQGKERWLLIMVKSWSECKVLAYKW